MKNLYHLYLSDHIPFIEATVSPHIDAELMFAASRQDLGGRLGLSQWGYPDRKDRILLVKTISVTEQLSVIFAMMAREHSNRSLLSVCANRLLGSDSLLFLEHLVLHETAHIKHRWDQGKDIKCDLWAFEMIQCKYGA